MDWTTYKKIADRPEFMSRWMLMQSSELLSDDLADKLLACTAGSPVEKPVDHTGSVLTDMFALRLEPEEAKQVLLSVQAAIASGRTTSATANRGLEGFLQAWQEFVAALPKPK